MIVVSQSHGGKLVALVQARMGSTRLPGKVLRSLAGKTVLKRVLERVASVPGIDQVVCATSDDAENDPVAAEASKAGFTVFRGDEKDVLSRHYLAAKEVEADAVLRITSDCPLADADPIGLILKDFAMGGADLVTNNDVRSWPHGLDAEVFTMAALKEAHVEATLPYEREHVTPFIKMRRDRYSIRNVECPHPHYAGQRWTLDTAADWAFFEALFMAFGAGIETASWREIAAFVETTDLPEPGDHAKEDS